MNRRSFLQIVASVPVVALVPFPATRLAASSLDMAIKYPNSRGAIIFSDFDDLEDFVNTRHPDDKIEFSMIKLQLDYSNGSRVYLAMQSMAWHYFNATNLHWFILFGRNESLYQKMRARLRAGPPYRGVMIDSNTRLFLSGVQ